MHFYVMLWVAKDASKRKLRWNGEARGVRHSKIMITSVANLVYYKDYHGDKIMYY